MGLQFGFLFAQLSGLSGALAKLVDFVLETCNLPLLFVGRASCFGEFGVERLFLILNLAAGGLRLRPDGLQSAHRLRQVLS